MIETTILKDKTIDGLNDQIDESEIDGWQAIGSHVAMQTYVKKTNAGRGEFDTIFEREYSITMQINKDEEN